MITTITLNPSVDKLYLVETLNPESVMRVKEVHNSAGGKGLNVARVVSLLGEEVLAMGFLGGFSGAYVRSLLAQDKVQDDFVEVPGETRSCINIRDLTSKKHTEFLEPGLEIPSEAFDDFLQRYHQAVAKSDVIIISGSVPKGTPKDFYGTLVKAAHQAGKPVLLDSSGEALAEGLREKPTMIKPNDQELAQLLGKKPETLLQLGQAAVELHKSGIPIVAVSLGKEGAMVACREGLFRGVTPDIPVVNTVGCGDSMMAAFGVAFANHYSVEEALRLALAVSTANAMSVRTGWLEKADLRALLPQVAVSRMM